MNYSEQSTQLAVDAQLAVYVMASPDLSEIEFLNLKPMASDSDRENLAARWPGRGLQGIGVIGRLTDGRVSMALRVPFDHIQLAALLLAFTDYREAAETQTQRIDDSVMWCERLYALQDPRTAN
jgi:hypothetical protein